MLRLGLWTGGSGCAGRSIRMNMIWASQSVWGSEREGAFQSVARALIDRLIGRFDPPRAILPVFHSINTYLAWFGHGSTRTLLLLISSRSSSSCSSNPSASVVVVFLQMLLLPPPPDTQHQSAPAYPCKYCRRQCKQAADAPTPSPSFCSACSSTVCPAGGRCCVRARRWTSRGRCHPPAGQGTCGRLFFFLAAAAAAAARPARRVLGLRRHGAVPAVQRGGLRLQEAAWGDGQQGQEGSQEHGHQIHRRVIHNPQSIHSYIDSIIAPILHPSMLESIYNLGAASPWMDRRLPTKWTYCNRCSSTRSCTTCGGSGRTRTTVTTT